MKNTIKILAAILIFAMTVIPVAAENDNMSLEQYMVELNGDVNGDGAIDNLDALTVLKYDVGIVNEFKNKAPVSVPLEGEKKDKVISDFVSNYSYISSDEITVAESYGVYDNCEVLFIDFEGMLEITATEYEAIGGYWIDFNDNLRLYAYKDGEFCDLKTAFDEGLISSADMLEVMKMHGGVYPTEYFDDSVLEDAELSRIYVVNRFGDVNCDRAIDNTDALAILKYDAGL